MKFPCTVWIFGLPITVDMTDELSEEGERCRGLFTSCDSLLQLDPNQADIRLTFWHEAIHAGVDIIASGTCITEEMAANIGAGVKESVERDPRNAKFVKWLRSK